MLYLVLSILISSSLYVIFKYFEIFKVNTFQAIIINYIVAFSIGYWYSDVKIPVSDIPSQPWFIGAIILGFLFITIFNVMALTSQKNGLSVASVSGRMSVVIPIVFGILLYDESISLVKVIGLALALLAVYLTSVKNSSNKSSFKLSLLLYPVILFFGSGAIDTLLKFTEINYVKNDHVSMFSSSIFGIAFIFGLIIMIIQIVTNKIKFSIKNVIAGIVLGIPNFFSIDFLLRALKTEGVESSILFTINNVSIVLLTTMFGLFFFKEKLEKRNWLGIVIAVASILLITL